MTTEIKLHTIKGKISSLEIEKDVFQVTVMAIGDYSVTEVETNTEKKTVWNVFVEMDEDAVAQKNQINIETKKNSCKAMLYLNTEIIDVDVALHPLVQEIYFRQQVAIFEVKISEDRMSIQKIILGGK